jgi:(p)ppGpp synthase/HD superfamily hydrolase
MMRDFKNFLNCLPHKFSLEQEKLLEKAYEFGKKAHEGQKRKSGEDYFTHALEAGIILAHIFPDTSTPRCSGRHLGFFRNN